MGFNLGYGSSLCSRKWGKELKKLFWGRQRVQESFFRRKSARQAIFPVVIAKGIPTMLDFNHKSLVFAQGSGNPSPYLGRPCTRRIQGYIHCPTGEEATPLFQPGQVGPRSLDNLGRFEVLWLGALRQCTLLNTHSSGRNWQTIVINRNFLWMVSPYVFDMHAFSTLQGTHLCAIFIIQFLTTLC